MLHVSRKKMLLEHLVVRKMNAANDLKQSELDDMLRWGAQELFADDAKAAAAAAVAVGAPAAAVADAAAAAAAGAPAGAPAEAEAAAEGSGGAAASGEAAAAPAAAAAAPAAAAAAAKMRRIVYDDAALRALLDRSELLVQAAAQADESVPEDQDLLKGFKVANFEMVDEEEEAALTAAEVASAAADAEEAEQLAAALGAADGAATVAAAAAAAAASGGASGADAATFWGELLQEGAREMQEAEWDNLGRGRRERRRVVYDVDRCGSRHQHTTWFLRLPGISDP